MEERNLDEEGIIKELENKLNNAEEDAKRNGKLIGRVTRYRTVRLEEEELIGVDISFEDYMRSNVSRGQYLAIRTILRPVIIVGQVVSISRSDVLAEMGIREVTSRKDPASIITDTFLGIYPISEFDEEKNIVRPAVTPIDPQSPVFIPNPSLLEKILRIPEEGITIGKIFSGGEEIEAKVRLDEEALVHHTLVLGTTGSGKTTLLKSILYSKDLDKQTIVFDRQGDFVNFLISKREKFTVLMPVTSKMGNSAKDFLDTFASTYGCKVLEYESGALICNDTEVDVIPYSINFFDNIKNFHKLTPYFTPKASMYWESLVYKTLELLKITLHEIFNVYINDNILDEILRDKVTPASLAEEGNRISISPTLLDELNLRPKSQNISKSFVSFSQGNLTISLNKAFQEAMKALDIAPSTKEAIIRTLKAYDGYGIFTVKGTVDFDPEKAFKLNDKIIVDLSFVMNYSASIEAVATIAYKILEELFNWKTELYSKRSLENKLTLIIMDEAHEYFPQGNSEAVAKDIIEELINKIMRLGRVRRIGVILATHMPDDLNPLVLQLTNTKIVMRNDINVIKKMGMENYEDFLLHATPGLAIINSLNFAGITIKTLIP
ncbi:MAG: ATP-binding protein [Acidianus sp.]|uniref:ATP-binding protein n=1 Tax=Acidianus sp. TaxID=1872104 RepID=UPI00397E8F96